MSLIYILHQRLKSLSGIGYNRVSGTNQPSPNQCCNIYFWLRFGSANAINNYWRLKIRVVCVGNLIRHTKVGFIFVYQKSFKRKIKPGFWEQILSFEFVFECCNYVVKKLAWNVHIKGFWYANNILKSYKTPCHRMLHFIHD